MVIIATALYSVSFYLLFANVLAAAPRRGLATAGMGFKGRAAKLAGRLLPGLDSAAIRDRLAQAGRPNDMDVDSFLAIKGICAFLAPSTALFLSLALGLPSGMRIILAIVIATGGYFWPDLWLRGRRERRWASAAAEIPDFLDMLTISVEAGLGLDAAIGRVTAKGKGPLAEEFRQVLREIQLGASRKQALENLTNRLGIEEIRSIVLAVSQADTFGVSIGKTLREHAKEMRSRRAQKAEEAAMKAPVKIVFPLVLCILPALFIVILGPAGIKMYQSLFLNL